MHLIWFPPALRFMSSFTYEKKKLEKKPNKMSKTKIFVLIRYSSK